MRAGSYCPTLAPSGACSQAKGEQVRATTSSVTANPILLTSCEVSYEGSQEVSLVVAQILLR